MRQKKAMKNCHPYNKSIFKSDLLEFPAKCCYDRWVFKNFEDEEIGEK